jgi:lauroyl/myristoyl acyltransferase
MNLEPLRYIYLRRVVGTLAGALGYDLADRLARRLARAVYNLNTPARRLAEARFAAAENSQLSPSLAAAPARASIRSPQLTIAAMYDHLARFWIEALFAKRLLRDSSWRRCVQIENEPGLQALADARRGCILATAYYGNIAVAAYALGRIFRPIHVVVDVFAQPYLRAWQNELYADHWVCPIERADAARAVPRILAAGGAIMMVCEHERPRGRAMPTPFLGRTLNCYPTLDRLSRWFNIPTAVVTCRREGEAPAKPPSGGCSSNPRAAADIRKGEAPAAPHSRSFTFTLSLHETIPPATPDLADGTVIRRAMAVLERAILAHPEQYLWSLPVSSDQNE